MANAARAVSPISSIAWGGRKSKSASSLRQQLLDVGEKGKGKKRGNPVVNSPFAAEGEEEKNVI